MLAETTWPFDEAVAERSARDIAGGKHASVVGQVTFGVPGVDGTALSRTDGSQGYVEVGDYFDFPGKQVYSIEFWAARTAAGVTFANVLEKRTSDNLVGWVIYHFEDLDNGPTSMRMEHKADSAYRYVEAPLADPKPMHHFVFVYEPNDFRAYVDGTRSNGTANDGDGEDTTQSLVIVQSYVGTIDELAIYDHALAYERIMKHFELGSK